MAVLQAMAVLIAAVSWGLYVPCEYAMKWRILCSGECNIRVDLLLIYPLLLGLSIAALLGAAWGLRRRAPAPRA
jgi:hypothetical protein